MSLPHSLYLHIPFCRHRCGYCDFNTYAGLDDLIGDYVLALVKEIELVADAAGEKLPIHTIFFGGGTPSLLPSNAIKSILQTVISAFELQEGAEITMEANPGTVDQKYLSEVRTYGINRLSLGVQSANPEELRILEREHGYAEAIEAVRDARKAGFKNISIDLIYGLPGQTLADWENNLALALQLAPEHISLYSLTVEHGTPLEKLVNRGLVQLPDPDLAADMYETTIEELALKDFVHYEISNWAKRDPEGNVIASRHNQQYWLNLPYLGLGAGAHGFAENVRTRNVLAPQAYINRCLKGGSEIFLVLRPRSMQGRLTNIPKCRKQ